MRARSTQGIWIEGLASLNVEEVAPLEKNTAEVAFDNSMCLAQEALYLDYESEGDDCAVSILSGATRP
jgi:hypothetical protein